jgi:hypothetical protein
MEIKVRLRLASAGKGDKAKQAQRQKKATVVKTVALYPNRDVYIEGLVRLVILSSYFKVN